MPCTASQLFRNQGCTSWMMWQFICFCRLHSSLKSLQTDYPYKTNFKNLTKGRGPSCHIQRFVLAPLPRSSLSFFFLFLMMQILACDMWAEQRWPVRQRGCVSRHPDRHTHRKGGTTDTGTDGGRSWFKTTTETNGGLLKFHLAFPVLSGLNFGNLSFKAFVGVAFHLSHTLFSYCSEKHVPVKDLYLIEIFNIKWKLSFQQSKMNKLSDVEFNTVLLHLWELVFPSWLVPNSVPILHLPAATQNDWRRLCKSLIRKIFLPNICELLLSSPRFSSGPHSWFLVSFTADHLKPSHPINTLLQVRV